MIQLLMSILLASRKGLPAPRCPSPDLYSPIPLFRQRQHHGEGERLAFLECSEKTPGMFSLLQFIPLANMQRLMYVAITSWATRQGPGSEDGMWPLAITVCNPHSRSGSSAKRWTGNTQLLWDPIINASSRHGDRESRLIIC